MRHSHSFAFAFVSLLSAFLSSRAIAQDAPQLIQDRFVDHDYQLAVNRPEGGFIHVALEPRSAGDAGIVRIVGRGYDGAVVAIPRPTGDAKPIYAYVAEALDRFAPNDPTFEFRLLADESEADYLGGSAALMRLMDERGDDPYVLECRIVERGDLLYRFEVGGALSKVGEDGAGLAPFFAAFELLDGEITPRAPALVPHDFDGPGYLVRDGVLESGHLGLRMAPPSGWRTASRVEAMYWGFRAEALFVNPTDGAKLLIETPMFPGQMSAPRIEGEDAAMSAQVLGALLEFEEIFPMGRPEAQDGARGSQLRVLEAFRTVSPASLAATRFGPIIPRTSFEVNAQAIGAAVAGAVALDADECASILAATTGRNDPQVGMARHAWLRAGVYTNVQHALTWTLPAGVWVTVLEPSYSYAMDRSSLLLAHNHAEGLAFELRARRTATKHLARAHAKGLRLQFDKKRADVKDVESVEVEWLGQAALRTTLEGTWGIGLIEFTTTLRGGHAIHASSTGMANSESRNTGELARRVCDAAQSDDSLPAGIAPGTDRFVDARFGIELDLAQNEADGHGAWTVEDLGASEESLELGSGVRARAEDGTYVQVIARWADPVRDVRSQFEARHEARQEALANIVRAATTVEPGEGLTVEGEFVPSVVARDADLAWESVLVTRGPILYTVATWRAPESASQSLPSLAEAFARIDLRDGRAQKK